MDNQKPPTDQTTPIILVHPETPSSENDPSSDTGHRRKIQLYIIAFICLTWILPIIIEIITYDVFSDGFWVRRNAFLNFIFTPFSFIRSTVSTLFALWLVWSVTPFPLKKRITDSVTPVDLSKYIRGILDSEDFLTTLRSTIPNGKDDTNLGLDFIPFMLHNIEERRKRFQKSAQVFLWLSLTLGLLFSSVLIFFGYILINEAAAGTPRVLANLEQEVRGVNENLQVLIPSLSNNKIFQQMVASKLTTLSSVDPGNNKESAEKLKNDITASIENNDVVSVKTILETAQKSVNKDSQAGQNFAQALDSAYRGVNNFILSQESAPFRLNSQMSQLNRVIDNANGVLSKPENHIPEVLKRLALGFVIATFFLAILRYIGNLYRDHYKQALRAEFDDLAIRKFYVAYKSTVDNNTGRQSVLASFMTGNPSFSEADSSDSDKDQGKAEHEILKEDLWEFAWSSPFSSTCLNGRPQNLGIHHANSQRALKEILALLAKKI